MVLFLPPKGKLLIKGLRCTARIGITPQERSSAQQLVIDAELEISFAKPAASGNISDTANYSEAIIEIRRIAEAGESSLLEALAKEIADSLKKKFRAKKVIVRIGKVEVAKRHSADFVGVEYVA